MSRATTADVSRPMSKRALTALRKSIAHWEDVVADPIHTRAQADDCALCRLYLSADTDCRGCPVAKRSGMSFCKGTPYIAFHFNHTRENAQAELDFLRSLLPEDAP